MQHEIKNFTQEQVDSMMKAQLMTQEVVNPDWKEGNYPFNTAMQVELKEILDHISWKWWNKGEDNLVQAQIEFVDFLKFWFSKAYLDGKVVGYDQHTFSFGPKPMPIELQEEGRVALVGKLTSMVWDASSAMVTKQVILALMASLDMSPEYTYELFMSKTVLFEFRMRNGYRDDTYVKLWDVEGNEDNHYLELTIKEMKAAKESITYDALTERLTEQYKEVIAK